MQSGHYRQLGGVLVALMLMAFASAAVAQQVRFIHAAPIADNTGGTLINVVIEGQQIISNMPYADYTPRIALPPGPLEFSVVRGNSGAELVRQTLTFDNAGLHWVYLIGDGEQQPFQLSVLDGTIPWIGGGDVPSYAFNAAIFDDLGPLLMQKADGTPAGSSPGGLSPIDFAERQYVLLQSGARDYKFTTPDGEETKIDLAPISLTPSTSEILQFVVIGGQGRQPLQVLMVPGGLLALEELPDADAVDNSVLGWWDTPSSVSDEGLIIHPLPGNRLVGTIYTYDENGSGNPAWFTFDGIMSGQTATAEVFASNGGRLGGDVASELQAVGVLELEFTDCHSGSAALSLESGASVSWELGRLTKTVDCDWD